jgi:CelD/BcsL family acetyltransferase involved in cellulose biosynthesis
MGTSLLLNAEPTAANENWRGKLEATFLDPRTDAAWEREVAAHPGATVFHSRAWAEVLAETYGHRPFYCRFSRNGDTVALLPLMQVDSPLSGVRGVSLPFTDFCEPLFFDDVDHKDLTTELVSLAQREKWKHLELRGAALAPAGAKPSVAFYAHSVTLADASQLSGNLSAPVRRAIRKAEHSGLEGRIVTSRDAMLEYYSLHVRTRRRHGLPPQPVSFFLNIQQRIMEAGLGFISLVYSGSAAVAGAVFFHRGPNAIYKFGASEKKAQELRPNNLAMWNGMKHLAAQGAALLDMGRSSMDNAGLRQFKLGWGAAESVIEYFKYDTAPGAWSAGADRAAGAHNAIFSNMPLAVNKLLGRLIYPHLD